MDEMSELKIQEEDEAITNENSGDGKVYQGSD